MDILLWKISERLGVLMAESVRAALPTAQISVVEAMQMDPRALQPKLTPDLCSQYDLIVPGWLPPDWSQEEFLAEFGAAVEQDKLWLVPSTDSGGRCGNASSERVTMVTSSFGYGDYFSVTGHLNRPLVDRLIVVTSVEDGETIRAAQAAGCEVMVTAVETPTRPKFAVIGHKNYFINRALRTVPAEDWVVYVDSDIVVPPSFSEFRKRSFEPGKLYGSVARRLCEDEADVLASYCDEPWVDRLEQCMGIIGYFGFFQRTSAEHQLPEGDPGRDDVLEQDDHLFLMSYESEQRVLTDFQVIHLGTTGINWRERRSGTFDANALLGSSQAMIVESDLGLLRSLLQGVGLGADVDVLRSPEAARAKATVDEVAGSAVGDRERKLAIWWEETDLRGILKWMSELSPDIDELYVVGKGLDHRFHPKMAAAIRFVFGRPDVVMEEGWWKLLDRQKLEEIRKLAELVSPLSSTEPLLVFSIPEGSSALQVIPWLESVAPEFVEQAAVFSGERAADIEMRALELGFRVLTGRYVENHTKLSCEERVREALSELEVGPVLVLNGRPTGECANTRLKEVLALGWEGLSVRNLAEFCRTPMALPKENDLIQFLHRLRLVDQLEDQPIHVVTEPEDDLSDFCLRLATWPLGKRATVYVCTKGDRALFQRLSKGFQFRVKLRRSLKETVISELRRETEEPIVSVPAALLCCRTAFLDGASECSDRDQLEPPSRSLQRWGWIDRVSTPA